MENKDRVKVYFIHSTKMDYNNTIYLPVLRSEKLSIRELMFAQSEENREKYYKDMIDRANILIVDLTNPDLSLNMEIKYAIQSNKPLLALASKTLGYDAKYQKMFDNIVGYSNEEEFRNLVETFVDNNSKRIISGKVDPTVVLGVLN